MPCDDCSRAETCPPCVNESGGSSSSSTALFAPGAEEYYRKVLGLPPKEEGPFQVDEDPPLTPEEEEQFCEIPHATIEEEEACERERLARMPQPERRPPYAVAYSVGGHNYEIALPGDATVRAVDGALIITHSLGPVAGIVQARPLEGEQSA